MSGARHTADNQTSCNRHRLFPEPRGKVGRLTAHRLFRILLPLAAVLGVGALVAGCSAVGALNAVTTRNTYSLQANVAYGPLTRQKIDIYRPAQVSPPDGWPVVVFFYGGSWNTGERTDYVFVGEALASRGILTLIADYRLYPDVRYPEFLNDSAQALAYGLDHAKALGGDRSRVFVMGHSAGGYNAAMLALDPRWLSATGHTPGDLAGWIGLAGPYDFYPIVNPDAKPVFFHPDYPPHSQPIAFSPPTAPRTFLAATKGDVLVNPQRNTAQLARKLQAAGVPVTEHIYERGSHVTLIAAFSWPLRWLMPVLEDVTAFVLQAPAAKRTALRPEPGDTPTGSK